MKFSILKIIILAALSSSSLSWAETRYITDEFKVTLRTGTSTTNSILTMLKSGEAVKFIEHDDATKYSLVETSKGKQGYVLTRFLDTLPSGREQFSTLDIKSKKQNETIKALRSELKELNQINSNTDSQAKSLTTQLIDTAEELEQLKSATRNTIAIIEQNKDQQTLIFQLETDKAQLLAENNSYKDSTAMDWFIRGSGVSLLAFLIGIIVTRIKWKKNDSWGEF